MATTKNLGATHMHKTRCQFATQMLGVAGAALMAKPLRSTAFAKAASSKGDLLPRMKWLNEPASATISGDSLAVRVRPKTDLWRKRSMDMSLTMGISFICP
jgi:hypothetical protein